MHSKGCRAVGGLMQQRATMCADASPHPPAHTQATSALHRRYQMPAMRSVSDRILCKLPDRGVKKTVVAAGSVTDDGKKERPPVTAIGITLLALTIALEVAGAMCMKLSNNFANPIPSVLLFIFYGSSFTLFTFALKHWHLSIAYAIWSGVGTACTAAIGIIVFGEILTLKHFVGIGFIIAGVIVMNF
jgi:small multidrug resistance pump